MVTLIEAAKTGNLSQVHRILRAGRTDINCRDSEKKGTPLFWAANGGHDDMVTMLLDNRADIEIPVKWGMTPLLAAVDRKHLTTAAILLARGADVDAQSQNGDTALHLAAYRGSNSLCRLLIDYGASKTFLNNTGKTAQQGAEAAGHTSSTKLLAQETNHKSAVCRSSSLPSGHRTHSPMEDGWREPRVPSESDDSPFIDDDEEWNSLQRKLSKPPLQHPMTMAIRRDREVIRYNSAQQLDKVGRASPPTNQPSIPHRRSPHLYPDDNLRPMRRGSNPEMQRDNRGGTPGHHVVGANFSGDLKQDRRWSPPLPRQHSAATPVRQYPTFLPQRDDHWEFGEPSGNGFSYETSGQNSKKMPHQQHSAPGYFRRDIGTRHSEPLQNVSNERDISHQSSPDTLRRFPEMEDIYHQLDASRRIRDDHIQQHQGILAPGGSATVNNVPSGPDNHVRWSADIASRHRDQERHLQGSVTRNKSVDQALQHQRLSPDSGSTGINYGQNTRTATNGQNPGRGVMDTSLAPDLEVRQLHSVIEKLLEDKLSLTERNQMMGEKLNQLESALNAALAADSSSDESWQTRQESLDSELVQALAKKLDSNLGRSSRLEQLCLKLLNDNQRLHALSASPANIDLQENRVPSDDPLCRRNGQSIPCKNPHLRPPNESGYMGNKSPSDRSTSSSSSLSPTSEASSYYEYGSGSDHLASSKKSSGDEECVLMEKTSSVKPNSGTSFSRECWRSLNSSYPRVAIQSGNIASTAMKVQGFTSQNRTDNIKKVLQGMNENDSDSRGQHSAQLAEDADGGQSGPSQTVDILEKLSQTCGADGNISAQFKCVMDKKLCILKVENSKRIFEQGHGAVENVEDILPPSPHLHLPFHRWEASLAGSGKFAQQLLEQLQENHPGIQETGHHSSGRGDGDVDLNKDAGYILDKDMFQCAVYPSVKLSLEDLFEWGMRNAEEDPGPCNDTGIIRILLQLLLAVKHLHQEGLAHGNLHPGCVYVMEDMRVVLGGLENARWFDERRGKAPHFKTASIISEVTAGQSSHECEDTFAVAATLCKLLVAQRVSSPDEVTKQQVYTPPDWLPTNLHNLLTEMLSSDPENRPPVKSALLRAAAMLYGPESDEVTCETDCEEWLISQALRLVVTAPHYLSSSHTGEYDCADSMYNLDWRLSRDFILCATPQELRQLCQQPAKT